MNADKNGIQKKYLISHTDGSPVDPDAFYWVLRIDSGGDPKHVAACRAAWRVYADEIKEELPLLAEDIYRTLDRYQTIDDLQHSVKQISAEISMKPSELKALIAGPLADAKPRLREELAKPLVCLRIIHKVHNIP